MEELLALKKEFTHIVKRNEKILYEICWLFFKKNEYEYDELKQEMLYALWLEYGQYKTTRFGECRETTWMYSVASRAAMNYKRNSSRYNQKFDIVSLDQDHVLTIHSVEDSDDKEILEYMISTLNVDDRRWIAVYYLGQYPYDVIAEREKISVVAARKRMSRIIQRLRKLGQLL